MVSPDPDEQWVRRAEEFRSERLVRALVADPELEDWQLQERFVGVALSTIWRARKEASKRRGALTVK